MSATSAQSSPSRGDLERAQRLARSIRSLSVFPLTAPIGLILGYWYIDLASELDEPPYDHRSTIVTLYENLFITLLLLGLGLWIAG